MVSGIALCLRTCPMAIAYCKAACQCRGGSAEIGRHKTSDMRFYSSEPLSIRADGLIQLAMCVGYDCKSWSSEAVNTEVKSRDRSNTSQNLSDHGSGLHCRQKKPTLHVHLNTCAKVSKQLLSAYVFTRMYYCNHVSSQIKRPLLGLQDQERLQTSSPSSTRGSKSFVSAPWSSQRCCVCSLLHPRRMYSLT